MLSGRYQKKNIGSFFNFSLLKQVNFDAKQFWVIKDDEGSKFFLPAKHYTYYNFSIGQKIICRLDQINCSGEIFLEPLHPVYKVGESYTFKYVAFEELVNFLGIKETICIVEDAQGGKHKIRSANALKQTNIKAVEAKVVGLKKGRLTLYPNDSAIKVLETNQRYRFKMVGEQYVERFGLSFLVQDDFQNLHAVPKGYYKDYHLEQHEYFYATVKRLSSKGFYYLEPEHPFYTLNQEYSFKVFDYIKQQHSTLVFVEDCFEQIVELTTNTELNQDDMVLCKVIGFKKGKPLLTNHF